MKKQIKDLKNCTEWLEAYDQQLTNIYDDIDQIIKECPHRPTQIKLIEINKKIEEI